MTTHRHAPASTKTTGYQAPARGAAENRRAHGAVCHIETCACGAQRETNSNGRHVEKGRWYQPVQTRFATDYDTNKRLGPATARLARESDEAVNGTNGVVLAYEVNGQWEYLPDHRETDFVRMGATVRPVYVLPEEV